MICLHVILLKRKSGGKKRNECSERWTAQWWAPSCVLAAGRHAALPHSEQSIFDSYRVRRNEKKKGYSMHQPLLLFSVLCSDLMRNVEHCSMHIYWDVAWVQLMSVTAPSVDTTRERTTNWKQQSASWRLESIEKKPGMWDSDWYWINCPKAEVVFTPGSPLVNWSGTKYNGCVPIQGILRSAPPLFLKGASIDAAFVGRTYIRVNGTVEHLLCFLVASPLFVWHHHVTKLGFYRNEKTKQSATDIMEPLINTHNNEQRHVCSINLQSDEAFTDWHVKWVIRADSLISRWLEGLSRVRSSLL